MHLEKCPVCEGRGHVPQGFYLDLPTTSGTTAPLQCRSCQGKGYLEVQDEIKFTTYPDTTYLKIECDGTRADTRDIECH